MGFSTIAGYIMMFFAVLTMLSMMAMIFGNLMDSSDAVAETQEASARALSSSVSIINVTYDSSKDPDMISIEAINDGKEKLELSSLDVFVDEVFIPRNENNRTIAFITPNTANPLHWDPGERLVINVSLDREVGSHVVVVSNEFGKTDRSIFIV